MLNYQRVYLTNTHTSKNRPSFMMKTVNECAFPVGGWPTPLKNIRQLGWLFPLYGKIRVMFQSPPTSIIYIYILSILSIDYPYIIPQIAHILIRPHAISTFRSYPEGFSKPPPPVWGDLSVVRVWHSKPSTTPGHTWLGDGHKRSTP